MTNSTFRPEYKQLMQLLVSSRQTATLTQTQLAKILNKPQSFVSKYENGERRLDLIEFLDIVAALNVEPSQMLSRLTNSSSEQTILEQWEISPQILTHLINDNPSLRGMLLGYVAEFKLREHIRSFPEVSYTTKFDDHDRSKKGDLYIVYKGASFDIESKSLQTKTVKYDSENDKWVGKAQVDASDRRRVTFPDGSTLNTTLLLRGEFDILAVNCFAFTNEWRFIFAKNEDLPTSTYRKYSAAQKQNLIASLVTVSWPPEPPFYMSLRDLLDEVVENQKGDVSSNLSLF